MVKQNVKTNVKIVKLNQQYKKIKKHYYNEKNT